MTSTLIPVAQYLRMSTEHQQYSLENQAAAIQKYALERNFEVVRTYSDAAKSGLVLKRRAGLRELLQDVASGNPGYRFILVYDVSRWGRFQDADESAHYEFLCKLAGVPVHYCAEVFANDGTLPSFIMKSLKRTMAGEFSRELGVRVLAGQKRLAAMGFKQGGMPGYGLRRLLVSTDRRPKQHLNFGERKSLVSDRVILVPGPAREVQVVRDIYRMLISEMAANSFSISVSFCAANLQLRTEPVIREVGEKMPTAIRKATKELGHALPRRGGPGRQPKLTGTQAAKACDQIGLFVRQGHTVKEALKKVAELTPGLFGKKVGARTLQKAWDKRSEYLGNDS
jgi:DNA invertase Pin-like site-specific DNA recombinase